MDECYFSLSLAWKHVMGPATSKLCSLPHDFLRSHQFLAVPCLTRDPFCLLLSVCPAVRQPRAAVGRGAAPRGIARSNTQPAQAARPGEEGWKMGIYHPLGSRAWGINIFCPTSLPVGRGLLRGPVGSVLRMSNSYRVTNQVTNLHPPHPGVEKSRSSSTPLVLSLALQNPELP